MCLILLAESWFSPSWVHYSTTGLGKRWPWSWEQEKSLTEKFPFSPCGLVFPAWVRPLPLDHIFPVTEKYYWTCLLLWLDPLSFRSWKHGLLFLPFTSFYLLLQLTIPCCKSSHFLLNFVFCSSCNYCLVLMLSM